MAKDELDYGEGPSIIRPFLRRTFDAPLEAAPLTVDVPAGAPPSAAPGADVRAYLMTGGRTGAGAVKLEFESMLSLTERGRGTRSSLTFERRRIAEVCLEGAQSVAELAAKMHLALVVAQVVAGDMVGDGLLNVHQASANLADDIAMIKRLIQGVRAL